MTMRPPNPTIETARPLTRRRVITIVAAAVGLALAPSVRVRAAPPEARRYRWSGRALGAETSIVIYHRDRDTAERVIGLCVDEIERLENEFSLYRPQSALNRLNRTGVLRFPSHDMVRLLADSRRFSDLTGGAFDITVQPLWVLYAGHFANPDADPAGPDRKAVESVLQRVDYRAVAVDKHAVSLGRPGMALTLNGIAQGYITDRVADLLRAHGIDRVLIDLGEIRGLGGAGDGRPWRVGVGDPGGGAKLIETLEVNNQAVATSAGAGTPFGRDGRHHHLFDPRQGESAQRYASVTVIAPTATRADALSTALSSLAPAEARRVLAAGGGETQGLLITADGRRLRL
jgi:thiamine biosynthesis lipoprotein